MSRSTADNAGGTENRRKGAAARVRGLVPGLALFAAGLRERLVVYARAGARSGGAGERRTAGAVGGHQGGSAAPGFTG